MREAQKAAMHSRSSSSVSATHSSLEQFPGIPETTLGVAGHGELLKAGPHCVLSSGRLFLPAPA